MDSSLRKKFSERLSAPPDPPLEATRNFLHSYIPDEDSLEAVRRSIRRMAGINKRTLYAGLAGIEGLLAHPPDKPGVLSHLVAYDANWVLDDPSDAGAAAWLKQLAEILREELGA